MNGNLLRICTCLILCMAALRGSDAIPKPPPVVQLIIEAATKPGIFTAADFATEKFDAKQLAALKIILDKVDWMSEIPNLKECLLHNYPNATAGRNGFLLEIYYSESSVVLLSCKFSPGGVTSEEANAKMETMLSSAERLVGAKTEVRSWLAAEWKKSWELYYKEGVDQKEVIRKKAFADYWVTVWGVPPDIVNLNCVRKEPNNPPGPTPKP
jgi:hypothetical protein